MKTLELLENLSIKHDLVGSRVTCDPAPTNTDQDVLVLADPTIWTLHLEPLLGLEGFEKGGSDCGDSSGYMQNTPMSFQSFTLGELNLIVTFDPEFYRRFMAATGVAKSLNLLVKDERIMLFQAVLYGNEPPKKLEDLPSMPPMVPSVSPWWVNGSACVEAISAEAAAQIYEHLKGKEAESVERIPYPASPRLNPYTNPNHGQVCPSFCHSPNSCKGRSSCPQRYSCTE